MTPKQLAQLEKLAAIKAQRRLAALSQIKARRTAEEARAQKCEAQAAQTYAMTPESAPELQMLNQMREGALQRADQARARAAEIGREEAVAHDAATLEKGRELALGEMAARARRERRKELEKRAESANSALLNLRIW